MSYLILLKLDKIADLFINNNENSSIIDQNKRKDTLIRMVKKKNDLFEDCGRIQNLKDESDKNNRNVEVSLDLLNNQNDKNLDLLNQKRKREKINYDPEIEPKVKILEYIYTHEKKNLNRNTILRIPIQGVSKGFENLLELCNKHFTKNHSCRNISEHHSFLDELTMDNDDFQQNKAIIIVPATFIPGNICIDNARKFLLDAQ